MKFDKDEIPVQSEDFWNIAQKKFNKITIKRKPCLIHVKGKKGFTKYKEVSEEIEGITNKDRKSFVFRSLARALTNVKPISLNMFLVLLGVGIVNIIIMFLGFTGRLA